MKKFLNSLKFIAKALLLIVLLLVGWAFVNVSNLIKSKKAAEKSGGLDKILGSDKASADVPSCGSCGCGGFGCPDVALFNGKKFVIDNDFLCGSPKYFLADYFFSKLSLFKERILRPDMVKFASVPKKLNGEFVIQLQENEEEESFVGWLKLIRILHPAGTEVVVDSGFNSFLVLDSKKTEDQIVLPSRVLINGAEAEPRLIGKKWLWKNPEAQEELFLKRNDAVKYRFDGLDRNKEPLLIVKSVFRDWMMGEASVSERLSSFSSLFSSRPVFRALMLALGALHIALGREEMGSVLAFTPFFSGSACSCGVNCCQVKSIFFSYQDDSAKFKQVAVNKPRAWKYGMEIIKFPKEAIRHDGSFVVSAEFTKSHKLAFVGVLQNVEEKPYQSEELQVKKINSSRLGNIDAKIISADSDSYVHMIPGDTVDIVFKDPVLSAGKNEKETYLMQSFGFYTALRREYKIAAENWQEKISNEAKNRLASLVRLKDYL